MAGYQEKLNDQVNLALDMYYHFHKILSFFNCEKREDRENFSNNKFVLDSASMFIQYITNLSLGNEISHYITPREYRIGEIRNTLSHTANRINNEIIYELTHYYLNFEGSLLFHVGRDFDEFESKHSDYEHKFLADDIVYFTKKSTGSGKDDLYMLSSSFYALNQIEKYAKSFRFDKKHNPTKDNLAFMPICYNILNGLDYLKLYKGCSKNELYQETPTLREVRNKIAHEYQNVEGHDVIEAIDEFRNILMKEYKNYKNEFENQEHINKENLKSRALV